MNTYSNTATTRSGGASIHYSRGKDKFDNTPEQRKAENFSSFADAVLKDTAPCKGKNYVCGPMAYGPHDDGAKHPNNAHWRAASHAEPRRFLPLDFDGFKSAEAYSATIEYLGQHSGFFYTTASHTPEAPRARAILETSRAMSRDESIVIGQALEAEMIAALGDDAIKLDSSVYRPEQPCYTPVTSSESGMFQGSPLDVDRLLRERANPQSATALGALTHGTDSDDLGAGLDRPPPLETAEEIARVKHMLACIPASTKQGCDRAKYLRVLWGIAALRWDAGKSLARNWCMSSQEDYDAADFERDWGSFDPSRGERIGVGTLCHMAEQHGYVEAITSPPTNNLASCDGWPEPESIKPALPAVMSFDPRLLPKAFMPYVEDQADLMQSPPDYIAVSLMVAAAVALGNIIGIAPKEKDSSWVVFAVLWGAIVGRPGVMKSPAIQKATRPLAALEATMAKAFEGKQQQYAADKILYEALLTNAKASAKKNGAVGLVPMEPEAPQPERLLANDSTVQKLGDLLRYSPRGILVLRDEVVSLLEQLGAVGQEGAKGFYLEGWNGSQSYRVDRIGRGSFIIAHLAIGVFGGIQPGKLQAYVRQATTGGGGDDGLLQRFQLTVWPDVTPTWKNVDREPDGAAMQRVDAAFQMLRAIDPVAIGATVDPLGNRPAYLHFTSEAQPTFDSWREKLESSLRTGSLHPALESHLSKYRSLIPALALLIHLIDGGTGPVTRPALVKAILWGKYLWSHAKRVYSSATNSARFAATALADKLVAGKLADGFSAREVSRHGWQHLTTAEDVRTALEWLTDAGWVRAHTKPPTTSGGRPTELFTINPRVTRK